MALYGKTLRILRECKGLTQQELARMVNVSTMTISKYENSALSPTIFVAKDIADIFGTTIDNMIRGEYVGK